MGISVAGLGVRVRVYAAWYDDPSAVEVGLRRTVRSAISTHHDRVRVGQRADPRIAGASRISFLGDCGIGDSLIN